ncbi:hypothetical protein [Brackiella oedipodis]|uniref:hypothetical protein n=1 Tax=Brackiella oedipodis TaxID=124225 RepID=UPI000491EC08|nr:hypothetical protein [Brackiella oedipodis]
MLKSFFLRLIYCLFLFLLLLQWPISVRAADSQASLLQGSALFSAEHCAKTLDTLPALNQMQPLQQALLLAMGAHEPQLLFEGKNMGISMRVWQFKSLYSQKELSQCIERQDFFKSFNILAKQWLLQGQTAERHVLLQLQAAEQGTQGFVSISSRTALSSKALGQHTEAFLKQAFPAWLPAQTQLLSHVQSPDQAITQAVYFNPKPLKSFKNEVLQALERQGQEVSQQNSPFTVWQWQKQQLHLFFVGFKQGSALYLKTLKYPSSH